MPDEEQMLQAAHTLDIAWILAIWHWIHGGDPLREGEVARTVELQGRALVGLLNQNELHAPGDIIEKLGQLGIKVLLNENGHHTEIKSTREFYERRTQTMPGPPITCMSIVNGRPVCFSTFWELFPPVNIRRM